jgi:hypothetical protein
MRGEGKLCVHEPKEMEEFTYVLTGIFFYRVLTAEHIDVKSESENIHLNSSSACF